MHMQSILYRRIRKRAVYLCTRAHWNPHTHSGTRMHTHRREHYHMHTPLHAHTHMRMHTHMDTQIRTHLCAFSRERPM
jgi:hypothetical protein